MTDNVKPVQPDPPCAVVGCDLRGRPVVCVFDGRFGEIVGLRFRPISEGWFGICNEHQGQIAVAMERRRVTR